MKVSNDQIVWVVNLMYVGVGLGSIVPFLLMDRIGRKGTLLFATIPKIASWILIGLAATIEQLYIGRLMAGVGCGITYSVMPMYLGEVSSKKTRGPLGSIDFGFFFFYFFASSCDIICERAESSIFIHARGYRIKFSSKNVISLFIILIKVCNIKYNIRIFLFFF